MIDVATAAGKFELIAVIKTAFGFLPSLTIISRIVLCFPSAWMTLDFGANLEI